MRRTTSSLEKPVPENSFLRAYVLGSMDVDPNLLRLATAAGP